MDPSYYHLALDGAVGVIGLWIRFEISKLREKTLEDERLLREWVFKNFRTKGD